MILLHNALDALFEQNVLHIGFRFDALFHHNFIFTASTTVLMHEHPVRHRLSSYYTDHSSGSIPNYMDDVCECIFPNPDNFSNIQAKDSERPIQSRVTPDLLTYVPSCHNGRLHVVIAITTNLSRYMLRWNVILLFRMIITTHLLANLQQNNIRNTESEILPKIHYAKTRSKQNIRIWQLKNIDFRTLNQNYTNLNWNILSYLD